MHAEAERDATTGRSGFDVDFLGAVTITTAQFRAWVRLTTAVESLR